MDLKLPHLGEGADSGTVVNLFVKEGDQITKDQPILELENEKAVATIPSTANGQITKIYVRTGDKISVGQNILSLTESGTEGAETQQKAEPAARIKPPVEPEHAGKEPEKPGKDSDARPEPKPGVAPAASPSIRKLARDLGIDLASVRGSESGGRIVVADLRAYIQGLQSAAAPQKKAAPPAPSN